MSDVEDRIRRHLAEQPARAIPDGDHLVELVRSADPLRSAEEVRRSVAAIRSHLGGLGVLEPLLADPTVTDVLVNGAGPVWVDRGGQLEPTAVTLARGDVELLVERIVAPLGRRADPVHALVDGRLPDGSRVHVAMPPLAVDGPYVTIRRFAVRPVGLAAFGPPEVGDLLADAVRTRANVVVSGATGSGKTTLLNALAGLVASGERIVTIEDAAELRLAAAHVVRLEARPPSTDGRGEVSIRELLRNALRMRPDRLVVGEVRGGEALDLLAALNTGHDGSLSTVHANSAADALHRLETLVLLAGSGLPLAAVRAQLVAGVDLVVHVARGAGGARRVVEAVAPVGLSPDGSVRVRSVAQIPADGVAS